MNKETFLEQTFRDKVKETEYQIFVAQWEYDKYLVPKALESVGNIFPHYSLHDDSHSDAILNNITNTLGQEAIKALSATDLWLILEAAYCHDLGMVVTADMMEKALTDNSFSLLDFHSTIIADKANPLYEYADSFEQKDGHLLHKDNRFSVDSYNAVKYLLSGYFRKYHAKNVKDVISDPMKNLSMASPRIGIPQRLFTVLGDICAAHGEDFDTVMKLNRVENGLGTDMAHPRFVACLLRIGDLLDIDDNRFSEMALRTLHKTRMPKDSINHYKKHHSIKHIRIDNRHIEASATCPDPQVAKVTKEWFDWIADEFNRQTSHWNDIKPHGQNCYLPTVGELNVDIEGYYNFDSKQMPQFTINTGKALELLQGNNLYNDIWDSIRELLQNAVDSTLIRYFKSKEDENQELPTEELTSKYLDDLKAFPIEVNLTKDAEGYILTIKDRGIGLKRDHLKFLSNTGNSYNNLEKNKIVARMPEWMKPSGTFGIGFQSVYLLTDRVDIVTKDYFTDECYELEMYKPSSAMKGDIYLKEHKRRINHSGLQMTFRLNSDKVSEIGKNVNDVNDVFGAVEGESLIEEKIRDKVFEYAMISLVPIKYKGKTIERTESLYFDKENGIELLDLVNGVHHALRMHSLLYYRNAEFYNQVEVYPFCLSANILRGKASDILGISRNKLKQEHEPEIEQCIVNTVKNWILSDAFDLNKVEKNETLVGFRLFALYYGYVEELMGKLGDCYDVNVDDSDFLANRCLKDGKGITFRMLMDSNQVEFSVKHEDHLVVWESKKFIVYSRDGSPIFKILSRLFENLYYVGKDETCYIFSHEEIKIKDINFYYKVGNSRLYYPYIHGYNDIYIPSSKAIFAEGIGTYKISTTKFAKILSPFLLVNGKIVDARNDSFYNFVHECNGKPIDSIKKCYDKYVEHVINVMSEKEDLVYSNVWNKLKRDKLSE